MIYKRTKTFYNNLKQVQNSPEFYKTAKQTKSLEIDSKTSSIQKAS